jgi:hypothetical protein
MPDMGKEIHLKLDSLDVGQILDGLRCRQESWANTAIYLRDGYFPDDAFVCEEFSDPAEAQSIADLFSASPQTSSGRLMSRERGARSWQLNVSS